MDGFFLKWDGFSILRTNNPLTLSKSKLRWFLLFAPARRCDSNLTDFLQFVRETDHKSASQFLRRISRIFKNYINLINLLSNMLFNNTIHFSARKSLQFRLGIC